MQPPSAKRPSLENSSDNFSQNVAAGGCRPDLPDDIVIYLGRFIVKHPVLHLFLLTSRNLAACALKAFAEFAIEGGALEFYSSDLKKAVSFALGQNLRTLNLRNLETNKPYLAEFLSPYQTETIKENEAFISPLQEAKHLTRLSVSDNHWVRSLMPHFEGLRALSLQENKMFTGSELTDIATLSKLTSLKFRPYRHLHQRPTVRMPTLTAISALKKLHLSGVVFSLHLPKLLGALGNLTSLNFTDCNDENDYKNDASYREIRTLYTNSKAAFTNLTSLRLTNESKAAWYLHTILDSLTNLKTLKLERRFHDSDEGDPQAEANISSSISKLERLETLVFVQLNLNEQILQNLGCAPRLKSLCLSFIDPTQLESPFGKGSEEHFTCIEALTSLEILDLSHQSLNLTHFHSIGRLTNLRRLRVGTLQDMTFEQFEEVKKLNQLVYLDLSYSLRNLQQDAFATFTELHTLRKLKLTIEDDIGALPLQFMPNLRTLKLTEASITDNNRHNMYRCVSRLSQLTQLTNLYIESSLQPSFTFVESICATLVKLQKLGFSKGNIEPGGQQFIQIKALLKAKKIRLVRNDRWLEN